ncbi:MAG: zinc ribbon domain-containing protein [Verrucomicrobiota bacterium]|jgi:putative FmdB family regulatory protein
MALYDYVCEACGEFALWRKLAERNLPAECPTCQAPAERMISAPQLSLMPAARRIAFARNEKSREDPGVKTRHRCGTGCGCGSSKAHARDSTLDVHLGAGRFKAPKKIKRPWMLGH